MSEELNQVEQPEEVVATKKERKNKKFKKPNIKKPDLKEVRRFVSSKLFLLIVVGVVLLYVVFFPHTKTTRVNAELTGVFAVQKERYLLHNMVEFSTNYVCVPGQTTKEDTIRYKLSGDIKSFETVNCDGTYRIVEYNSNGTQKYFETIAFVGADIQITVREYSKLGLLESQTITLSGTTTVTENSYFDSNIRKETIITTTIFGEKVGENITKYNEDLQKIEETLKQWANGDLTFDWKTTYTNGNLVTLMYSDKEDEVTANVTCNDTTGVCTLDTLTAPKYSVEWNDTGNVYELDVDGETAVVNITFPVVNEFNMSAVLASIEFQAQAILDAQ